MSSSQNNNSSIDLIDMAARDGTEYNRQVKKNKPNENTFLNNVKDKNEIIGKEALVLQMKSLLQSNILEKVLLTGITLISIEKKCQTYLKIPISKTPL